MKNTLFGIFVHHRRFVLMVCCTLMVLVSAISINLNAVNRTADKIIIPLGNWVNQHKTVFLFYHFLIILAVYSLFGLKINKVASKHCLSAKNISRLKLSRWLIIAAIIGIDLIVFIGR